MKMRLEPTEFATMTPHAIAAVDEPAEVVMIFDRSGQRAHTHHDDEPGTAASSSERRS